MPIANQVMAVRIGDEWKAVLAYGPVGEGDAQEPRWLVGDPVPHVTPVVYVNLRWASIFPYPNMEDMHIEAVSTNEGLAGTKWELPDAEPAGAGEWMPHQLPRAGSLGVVSTCRFCQSPIRCGVTTKGKSAPFDATAPHPNHWITCTKRVEADKELHRHGQQ